jgi:hypothetical protein
MSGTARNAYNRISGDISHAKEPQTHRVISLYIYV